MTREAAVSWVSMKMAADWGAMPEKVSVKMRPIDTAGLAKTHPLMSQIP